jgi:hypothetical protein
MQRFRIGRRTNAQWFDWISEARSILRPFLLGLLFQLLQVAAKRLYRSRGRVYATIFGDLVLSLLFASCASVFAAEVLSTLLRPLFQESTMWLLVSMALGITALFAGWLSVLPLWSRESRRQILRYALKASGVE